MNFMKRSFLFILIMMGLLCACENQKDTYTLNAIQNVKTGATIVLGMTIEEVEALIGKGTNYESNHNIESYTYGSGEDMINVHYKDNIATGISTDSDDNWDNINNATLDIKLTNWCAKYGVTHGDSMETVIKNYGEAIHDTTSLPVMEILSYNYDAFGNLVKDTSATYLVAFYIKNEKVFSIEIRAI